MTGERSPGEQSTGERSTGDPRWRLGEAILRLGLVALPRELRNRASSAVLEMWSSRLRDDPRALHLVGRWRLLFAELVDLLWCGVRERSPWPIATRSPNDAARGGGGGPRARSSSPVNTMLHDIAWTLRNLRRRPGFACVVIATLTLGIGANTAMFSIVHAVLMRPLPLPRAHELVRVWPLEVTARETSSEKERRAFSLPDYVDLAREARTLRSFALYSTLPGDLVLETEQGASELETAFVSAGFFETLEVPAAIGRTLRPEEERSNARVVVLADHLWRTRFGGDRSIVGRTLTFEGESFLVAGVMPPSFNFPSAEVELWTFLAVIPSSSIPLQLRAVRLLDAVARLAPGTTREQAEGELSGLLAGLAAANPESNEGLTQAVLVPLREAMVGDSRRPLLILFGAVSLILLIGCANLANLLLARGAGRSRELALRSALGASRWRLTRLLFTENLVLALLGGLAGWLAATWVTRLVAVNTKGLLPRVEEVGLGPQLLDLRVLIFSAGLAIACALLFGLLPARHATLDLTTPMRRSVTAPKTRGTGAQRGSLVAFEIALSTVLLIGAGLMLRSLERLYRVDPGFATNERLAVSMIVSDARYPQREQYLSHYEQVLAALAAIPGVAEVASIRTLPLRGRGESVGYRRANTTDVPNELLPSAYALQISPNAFRVLGVPLLAGHALFEHESDSRRPVVVINETLARQAFGATPREALGQKLDVGLEVEVVGVVGDVRHAGLGEPAPPMIYLHQRLRPRRAMTFVLRASPGTNPLHLIVPARAAITRLDPTQAISDFTSLEQVVHDSVARPRLLTWLLLVFASLAVALATVGVYGTLAYRAGLRTKELGIRAALGARRGELAGWILHTGVRPALLGVVVGGLAALAVTRLLRGLLFQVSTFDWPTYGAVALLLVLLSGLACAGPAWRASRSDVVAALRAE